MIELLLAAENALVLGLLDQAEQTYGRVLEADPRNGIAAVGLARVALERGDVAGALARARAALEIDPESGPARRMVERLEEVAVFRPPPGLAAEPAGPRPPNAAVDAGGTAAPPQPQPAGPAPTRRGFLRRLLRRS